MATTTNFGWTTPNDTDLVKDGAAAIRTLGQSIDTSLMDLEGGTTGQVLAKNSNTDMDFVWATDASGIPATIFDAKGDIIAATAADTASRLAVGTNGQVLTAASGQATGLSWTTPVSGSMTLINSGGTTLTGASVAVGSIPATYRDLRIVAVNFIGANLNTQLRVKITGLGSVFATVNPSDSNPIGVGDPSWYLTDNQINTGTGYGLTVWDIPEYANSSVFKMLTKGNSVQNASATTMNKVNPAMFGVTTSIAAISSLTFSCTSGNLTSGTVYVYGVL